MPDFKLPLSGNVSQTINPWTFLFNPQGGQYGLVNVNLGNSSNPSVEQDVLTDVASYGKQLGRIEDALTVLLAHFHPKEPLKAHEKAAIHNLNRMLEDIADVKARHKGDEAAA